MASGARAPAGLAAAGRAFWRSVHDTFTELAPAETALLTQICRTLDQIDVLATAAEQHGPLVAGSRGQLVINPAVTEVRLQRLQLGRLLDQLGLPADDDQAAPSVASRHAKRAADARWGRGGRPRVVSSPAGRGAAS